MVADTDGLFAAMHMQADAEKSEILTEAEAKIRDILARTDAECDQLRVQRSQLVDEQVRLETMRITGHAGMDRRTRFLSMKRALLKETFARVREYLLDVRKSDDYEEVLDNLIEQAVRSLDGNIRVAVADQDVAFCRKALAKLNVDCPVDGLGDEVGAVVVTSADGLHRMDNSLSTRLTKVEASMEQEVAGILFGSGQVEAETK